MRTVLGLIGGLLAIGCFACGETGRDANCTTARSEALFGGEVASPGQFPATVALLIPHKADQPDTLFCTAEDLRCTAAVVGKNTLLTAAHCLMDADLLSGIPGQVVSDPRLATGKQISVHYGPTLWQDSTEICASSGLPTWEVPPDSHRVTVTIENTHVPPSYWEFGQTGGAPSDHPDHLQV